MSTNCLKDDFFLRTKEFFLQNERIRLHLDGNLSIFDYERKNALLFSQGDWSLVRRDLSLANIDASDIDALENGPCQELIRAFRVRRELIHYKKVCLHLFEEARSLERELKQVMSFFFWYDGDNKKEGAETHMRALVSLMEADLDANIASPLDLDAVRKAKERHEDGDSCELIDRKLMYVLASGAWMYHRGIIRSLQDARDIAKAICLSPRHPEGEAHGDRPFKLKAMPNSMQVEQAVLRAEREDPLEVSRIRKRSLAKEDSQACNNDNDIPIDAQGNGVTKGKVTMDRMLDKVRNELSWSEENVYFLSLSIAARGGFKALAIVEELSLYDMHLSKLPARVEKSLQRYNDAQTKATNRLQNSTVTDEDLSAAVQRHKEIHHLRGILNVCQENAKWISVLNTLVFNSKDNSLGSNRLFVAGDDLTSNGSFVPEDFQLGTCISSSRKILDDILIPTMRRALKKESWPPELGSRRRRVLAFDEITVKDAVVGKKKLQQCNTCSGFFDSRWIRHQICSICEAAKRDQSDGTSCFFVGCKAGTEAYCPHDHKCFVCDAPHSCNRCRLSMGNGEVLTAMVETIRPKLLLLDFDRTLCSTKSGASPLPKASSSKHQLKEGFSHSIDSELRVAVMVQQTHGESHVITRNSHKLEIETFLEMHGLRDLAQNVHVVPKKVKKGSYILDNFSENATGNDSFIFVDDDIKELCNDPWLRSYLNMHRLLFRRY